MSIARAFLKNAPILLLDEATASLDVDNETLIQTALSRLIQDRTVLVIAHRMRTVEAADKIVVLADGLYARKERPDPVKGSGRSFGKRKGALLPSPCIGRYTGRKGIRRKCPMKPRIITGETLAAFRRHLQEAERRPATVAKYLREIQAFAGSLRPGQLVTKETVLAWKEALAQRCAPSTVNGKLAALNTFFAFLGWGERELFRDPGRELDKGDYLHLLDAARKTGNWRLYYLMETLASTGVRVSELQYVTVQALHTGRAWVEGKGKGRLVLLTAKLCRTLGKYCRKRGIVSGPVFVTRSGRPLDRSNIWREMRALCAQAGVEAKRVFPHNFRHLFARAFYALEKDIAKLADLLGHASVETTRIYIMESGAEHTRQVERLGLVL